MKFLRLYDVYGKLIASYRLLDEGDVEKVWVDRGYSGGFDLTLRVGISHPATSQLCVYNTPKDASPSECLIALCSLYKGHYGYEFEITDQ